jgi:hypothetical protein
MPRDGCERLFGGWVARVLVTVALSAGCAANASDEPARPGADTNSGPMESGVTSASSVCCPEGFFTCPDDESEYAYGKIGCSLDPSRSSALNACDAHCVRTCTDSGWFCLREPP